MILSGRRVLALDPAARVAEAVAVQAGIRTGAIETTEPAVGADIEEDLRAAPAILAARRA